jgi:NADH-quinone oxidoreductase subunit M
MPELTALLHKLKPESQRYLWWLLAVPFLINLGMVPFHHWLLRAHAISEIAILSSFMLVGLYGLFKIPLALLPKASMFFSQAIFVICNVSIIYLLLAALRKRELKPAILYAAVANLSYAVLGLFSFTAEGLYGFILQAASHGFIFFLLFILLGFLSKHAHLTNEGYAGLAKRAPRFAVLFSFAFLALLSPFMGKLLNLMALYKASKLQCFIAALGIILMVACLLPLYIKGLFAKPTGAHQSNDITHYEVAISLVLIVFIVVLSLYPDLIGNITKESGTIFLNSIKAYG